MHLDDRLYINGLTIEQQRFVAQLLDCIKRCLGQQRVTAHQVQILDRAVLADHDEYSDRPLNSSGLSEGRVNRFNAMRNHFLGYFSRKPNGDEVPRGVSPSGLRDDTRFIEVYERKWQVDRNFRRRPVLEIRSELPLFCSINGGLRERGVSADCVGALNFAVCRDDHLYQNPSLEFVLLGGERINRPDNLCGHGRR